MFLQTFAGTILVILWGLVFGRVLMGWIDPRGRWRLARLLVQATEPLIGPVRRALPPAGMVDYSGLVVLLVLGVLWRAILR